MSVLQASPTFGGKKNKLAYYMAVDSILRVLRPASTLRIIAAHLNAAGFKTPNGLDWNRSRVATYIRSSNSI